MGLKNLIDLKQKGTTMMKNKKSFLWLYALISLVIIVATIIVSLTAGISTGTDIGGGNQVEVKITAETNEKTAVSDLKEIMADNGCVVERIFVQDKFVDTYVVAKTAKKEIKNQDTLKSKIAEKLNVDVSSVEIFEFEGRVTNKIVIWTSVGIVCLLLGLFIIGWIRYGLVSGTTLTIITLHSLLLAISLMILTRLPITMISIIEILASVALSILATILLLEKIRENKKMKHNENLSSNELVSLSSKEILKPLIFAGVLVLAISLVLVFVPVRLVTLSAVSLVVCLASTVYSYYLLGTNLQKLMLTIQENNQKARLSKNVSPAPAKTAKKTSKKSEKTTEE